MTRQWHSWYYCRISAHTQPWIVECHRWSSNSSSDIYYYNVPENSHCNTTHPSYKATPGGVVVVDLEDAVAGGILFMPSAKSCRLLLDFCLWWTCELWILSMCEQMWHVNVWMDFCVYKMEKNTFGFTFKTVDRFVLFLCTMCEFKQLLLHSKVLLLYVTTIERRCRVLWFG